MNAELHALFQADREESIDQPRHGTLEYTAMRERDHQRRMRAAAIIAEGGAVTADDFYHAALLFNTAIRPTMHGRRTHWHFDQRRSTIIQRAG